MNDDEKVGGELVFRPGRVLFHLGRRAWHTAVLDREGMEMEHVFQDRFGLLRRGSLQVHPEEKVGVRQQRRHQQHFEVPAVQPALGRECERTNHAGVKRDA